MLCESTMSYVVTISLREWLGARVAKRGKLQRIGGRKHRAAGHKYKTVGIGSVFRLYEH